MIVFSQHYTFVHILFVQSITSIYEIGVCSPFYDLDDKNTLVLSSSQTVNRATKCPLKLVVFSVLKKSNHYVPCYRLKLQLLLNFAKVAFFDHHTTYCLSHILKKRSEKIKILMTAFMSMLVHPETRDGRLTNFLWSNNYFPNTFFR